LNSVKFIQYQEVVDMFHIICIAVAVVMLIYLLVALIKPEIF